MALECDLPDDAATGLMIEGLVDRGRGRRRDAGDDAPSLGMGKSLGVRGSQRPEGNALGNQMVIADPLLDLRLHDALGVSGQNVGRYADLFELQASSYR